VDQVHGIDARVHGMSFNMSRSSSDLRPGLNDLKGYPALLILAIDAGMDDPRQLGRQGRHDCGDAPGTQRRLVRVGSYQCSSPQNTMRSSPTAHLAHHGLTAGDGGG
jgi:hypothetical protein